MRKEKQLLLDEIKEMMDKSSSIVITRYQKMNPNLFYDFRGRIGDSGGDFEVVRKRVLVKAAEKANISLDYKKLGGHIGIVFSYDDPISTAKELVKFSEENAETFEILLGQFEGKVCSAADVSAIASLPSKDEMRSQFLATLEAPMSQTLATMEALLTSVIYCLENKCSTGEEASK